MSGALAGSDCATMRPLTTSAMRTIRTAKARRYSTRLSYSFDSVRVLALIAGSWSAPVPHSHPHQYTRGRIACCPGYSAAVKANLCDLLVDSDDLLGCLEIKNRPLGTVRKGQIDDSIDDRGLSRLPRHLNFTSTPAFFGGFVGTPENGMADYGAHHSDCIRCFLVRSSKNPPLRGGQAPDKVEVRVKRNDGKDGVHESTETGTPCSAFLAWKLDDVNRNRGANRASLAQPPPPRGPVSRNA